MTHSCICVKVLGCGAPHRQPSRALRYYSRAPRGCQAHEFAARHFEFILAWAGRAALISTQRREVARADTCWRADRPCPPRLPLNTEHRIPNTNFVVYSFCQRGSGLRAATGNCSIGVRAIWRDSKQHGSPSHIVCSTRKVSHDRFAP